MLFLINYSIPLTAAGKGQGELQQLEISPCPSQPCELKKGTKVSVKMTFIPRKYSIYRLYCLWFVSLSITIDLLSESHPDSIRCLAFPGSAAFRIRPGPESCIQRHGIIFIPFFGPKLWYLIPNFLKILISDPLKIIFSDPLKIVFSHDPSSCDPGDPKAKNVLIPDPKYLSRHVE